MKYLSILLLVTILFGCQKDENDIPEPVYPLFVIVVEEGLYNGIKENLDTYINETARGDSSAKVILWPSNGTALQLRDTINGLYNEHFILGAFLIGNLPFVRYEMDNWDKHEEFPSDLYFSSPNTNWYDNDQDNMYDGYSSLNVKYFVSRIQGGSTEINSYLNKVHFYRTSVSQTIQKRAYLFVDNEWADFYAGEKFGINSIYSDVLIDIDTNLTTMGKYENVLSGSGAEYVMQLIHASNSTLFFEHNGDYETMSIASMTMLNPKARFYNLFDCSACKYDEDNLGMSYVMSTSYGLAVMGTTKTGGNYYPQSFNLALAGGKTWGESFVKWWRTSSSSLDDKWYMGLVIFGDPMLTITKTAKGNEGFKAYLPLNSIVLDESMRKSNFR